MHRIESTNITTDADGNWIFTDGPPGTTVTADWLNSVQEEIANVIESAGINLKRRTTDTNDQLDEAIRSFVNGYDIIVSSQTGFNNIIEKNANNDYQIKSDYRSVYIKFLPGGYQCSGATSFLEDADTWGTIKTNSCELLFCEPNGYFDFGDERGHIIVDTNNAALYNVEVRGGAVAVNAVAYCFLLDAEKVLFQNCKATNRWSTDAMDCFGGSAVAEDNKASKYIGCVVHTCKAVGTFKGFDKCKNLIACQVQVCESTAGACYGMYQCNYMAGITVDTLDAGGVCVGFYNCNRINAFILGNLTSANGDCIGIQGTGGAGGSFYVAAGSISTLTTAGGDTYGVKGAGAGLLQQCLNISTTILSSLNSTAGSVYGMQYVKDVSACAFYNLDTSNAGSSVYVLHTCHNISNCQIVDLDITGGGAGNVIGMETCGQIASTEIYTLDSNGTGDVIGINNSSNITGCNIHDLDSATCANIVGIYNSENISACDIHDLGITNNGTWTLGIAICNNVAACKIYNLKCNFSVFAISQTDHVTSCYADNLYTTGNGLVWGFYNCDSISCCEVHDLYATNAGGGSVVGFIICNFLNGCRVSALSTQQAIVPPSDWWGFRSCSYGATLYAPAGTNNSQNDYIDTSAAACPSNWSCDDALGWN